MKSINGTYFNGVAVNPTAVGNFEIDLTDSRIREIGPTIPDYVASGTVTLADGSTVPCMEVGRTKNGYAKLILQDGREIKTDPAQYREAGSLVPFFDAFPYARVPGMVPIVAR